jgi:hypothetical protein
MDSRGVVMGTITKITKKSENGFIVETDTIMSDGSYLSDFCKLEGNELSPVYGKGVYRIGTGVRVKVGPKTLAILTALKINESWTP